VYILHVPTTCHPASTARPFARVVPLALAGALSASAGACGDAGILVEEGTVKLGTEAERAQTWEATAQEPITIELTAPATVKRGAEVPIRVKVHNGSTRALSVGFGRQRVFDVLVSRAQGRADSSAVWSLPTFYSTVRDVTVTDPVPPGRDTVFAVTWPGVDDAGRTVPPGASRIRATVSAELVSTRQLWTPWVPITVEQ
jgi:hypothetical protein